jgi:transposase-like protein
MPTRIIAPSAQLRQSLAEFLATGIETDEAPTSALLTLASRLVLQEALEAEQREALGRARYQRGSPGSHRHGYRPGPVEGTGGRVDVAVPQVPDAPTPEAGQQAAAETIAHFQAEYPRAMQCFAEGLEAARLICGCPRHTASSCGLPTCPPPASPTVRRQLG